MKMRPEYSVLLISLTVVLVTGSFFAERMNRANFRAIHAAVNADLRRLYDEIVRDRSSGAPLSVPWVSGDAVSGVLLEKYRWVTDSTIMSGVASLADCFVPTHGVTIPGANLVCVVRISDGELCGISDDGSCHNVTEERFNRWPHRNLAKDKARP